MLWTPAGPVIKKLEPNLKGRDFVVGDMHGNRRALDVILRKIKFNTSNDRLFSVGDLVDRGPENMECLELLKEPWFNHALGNHDFNNLLLYLIETKQFHELSHLPGVDTGIELDQNNYRQTLPWDPEAFACENGGRWIIPYFSTTKLEACMEFMLTSPHIIQVGQDDDRFHVVHAGLHSTTNISPKVAANDNHVDTNIWAMRAPYWGTIALMAQRYESFQDVPNLSLTYCGHTPVSSPLLFASHYNIDTGAGKGGILTVVQHNTKKAWQVETA